MPNLKEQFIDEWMCQSRSLSVEEQEKWLRDVLSSYAQAKFDEAMVPIDKEKWYQLPYNVKAKWNSQAWNLCRSEIIRRWNEGK